MANASADLQVALDRDAVQLIDSSPTKDEMEGHAAFVKDKFLKDLKLSINLNLQDSEDFTKEVMANVANASGIKASVKDVDKWSKMTYDELSQIQVPGVDFGKFANNTTMATAQAGLDVAGQVYGGAYNVFSLTGGMLEKGSLDIGTAIQLGASAVSLASTVIAGATSGAALGPYGAIAGVALAGISYLTSSKAQEQAMWDAKLSAAGLATAQEERKIDEFNTEQKEIFWSKYKYKSKVKDEAVAEVADNWAALEEDLGVRFGLRYFPGAAVPVRGGLYRKEGRFFLKDSKGSGLLPPTCTSLAGCPYFPEPSPARVAAIGYAAAMAEMVDALAKRGLYLADPNSSVPVANQYVFNEQGYNAYYDRTLRAFSAYVGEGNYWVPENQRTTTIRVKTYQDLVNELYCDMNMVCSPKNWDMRECSSQKWTKENYDFCKAQWLKTRGDPRQSINFALGQQNYPTDDAGLRLLNLVRTKDSKAGAGFVNQAFSNSQKFWSDLMKTLEYDVAAANVFKTRINADLLQTANAVGGELATSIRLRWVVDQVGTRNIQNLSQTEKQSVSAVSEETRTRLQRRQTRDGLLNNGMLALGSSALGYSAYKKWGR